MIEVTTKEEFDKVIGEGGTVLVDFYAPWCGPCKMIAPSLEELSEVIEDVTFIKVNADELKDISDPMGVMSIPNLMLFKDGEKVDQKVGYLPKEAIEAFIKN